MLRRQCRDPEVSPVERRPEVMGLLARVLDRQQSDVRLDRPRLP
jgi:hypothetical protein